MHGASHGASHGALPPQDRDTLLVGGVFGEAEMTDSGYPRTVREWKRGTPLDEAPLVFEGEASDVSVRGEARRTLAVCAIPVPVPVLCTPDLLTPPVGTSLTGEGRAGGGCAAASTGRAIRMPSVYACPCTHVLGRWAARPTSIAAALMKCACARLPSTRARTSSRWPVAPSRPWLCPATPT